MTKKNFLLILAVVTGCILFLTAYYCFAAGNNENTKLRGTASVYELQGWVLEGTGVVELPYAVQGERGQALVISSILPEKIPDYYEICFQSVYSKCEVYVEEHLIGSYGIKQSLPIGNMVGNIRVCIPVSPDMSGKEIVIKMVPYYSMRMEIPEIKFGFSADLEMSVLKTNMWRVVVCTILLTVAVLALGLAVFQWRNSMFQNSKMFLYFGIMVLLIILWLVCSSDIPQFFTSANEAVSFVSFLTLTLLGIPFMGYCRQVLTMGRELFYNLEMAGWFLALLITICFLTGISDPPQILILTHLYIVVVMAISLWLALKEWKHSTDSKILAGSIIQLLVASAIGLICFYVSPTSGRDAMAFGGGALIFSFTLFGLIVYREMRLIEEKQFLDIYKRLAYNDIATGLGNREAFELQFANMKDVASNKTIVTLIIMDLNYLKKTNDSLGYRAGDEVIRGFSECMERTFGDRNVCFRLGGDEFAALLLNSSERADILMERLNKNISMYNRFHRYKLSVAKGYAQMNWRPGEEFQKEIFKAADEAMCEDKRKYHIMAERG